MICCTVAPYYLLHSWRENSSRPVLLSEPTTRVNSARGTLVLVTHTCMWRCGEAVGTSPDIFFEKTSLSETGRKQCWITVESSMNKHCLREDRYPVGSCSISEFEFHNTPHSTHLGHMSIIDYLHCLKPCLRNRDMLAL